jgi:hypothetical protein
MSSVASARLVRFSRFRYSWVLGVLALVFGPAAGGALVAEVEHLRRIGELLPSLDEYLERMTLPKAA